MTQIDFHTDLPNKISYCCRLVRKAHASGAKLVVVVRNQDELTELDQALWSISDIDFIPHAQLSDALVAHTPVILMEDTGAELPHYDVLINLAQQVPAQFARFKRVIELIDASDSDRQAGRVRYRQYKEQGHPLEHRKVGTQ